MNYTALWRGAALVPLKNSLSESLLLHYALYAACRGITLALVPLKNSLSEFLSGAEEDRTPDLLNANQALSQLSYCP